jgi:hypothetical protein
MLERDEISIRGRPELLDEWHQNICESLDLFHEITYSSGEITIALHGLIETAARLECIDC